MSNLISRTPDATTAVAGKVQLADAAAMEAETADRAVTADLAGRAPSAAKAWAYFNTDGSINASHGVSSVTDNGAGDFTVNWETDFSMASYAVIATCKATSAMFCVVDNDQAVGSVSILSFNSAGTQADALQYFVAAFGDQ